MTTPEYPLPVQERFDRTVDVGRPCIPVQAVTDTSEMLSCIPTRARRILHLGCKSGELGLRLKESRECEVVGVELGSSMAETAMQRLDQVILGDPAALELPSEVAPFDCVVCERQLDHALSPLSLLARCRRWLAPGGSLIVDACNLRQLRCVQALIRGSFMRPEGGGTRYYTQAELEKLLYRAGFATSRCVPVANEELDAWERSSRLDDVRIGTLHLSGLTPADAREYYTRRFLLRAEPADPINFGLTSIIIVTHNELSYTRSCVESIKHITDEPYELVFVDNGSTDGTVDYLRSIPNAKLIENPDNRGFPAAVNQGLQQAEGEQFLLLNNDTLVTTGWLRRLLSALNQDSLIGLVGPYSNCVGGYQRIECGYEDLSGLDGFAWRWGKSHPGQTIDVERLIGFCLLIRREVYQQLGEFDEQFGIGNFEDDDYCRRAAAAGFRIVIAQDAFVHHFGSRTFQATGIDYEQLFRQNETRFHRKWEAPTDPPSKSDPSIEKPRFGVEKAEGGGLRLVRRDLRLSLCMIVRDNEETIGPCLGSIQPWVDEMVVVDTGSQDRTPDIVREHGARLYHFPWCDDFSAARNESLRFAKGDWIFWMDSDDTISSENGRRLRDLADRTHDASVLGHIMQVHCPGLATTDVTTVDHVKLFRNRPDLRFEGRIHEQIIPAIRRAGGEVSWTDVFVVHSGSDPSPEARARKIERDLRILRRDLAERPDHPFVLFNLGMTYADNDEHDEAVAFLKRSLERSSPEESHVRKAYALLIGCLVQLEKYSEARQVLQTGQELYSDDPELWFRRGMLEHHFQDFTAAEEAYLTVLKGEGERHFSSIDAGILGFKTRHNLAVVYADAGKTEQAIDQWRQINLETPTYRPAWSALAELLLRERRFPEVEKLDQELAHHRELDVERRLISVRMQLAEGSFDDALQEIEACRKSFPDDEETLRLSCQLHFEHGHPQTAVAELQSLMIHAPHDASAHHNLGAMHLNCEQFEAARKELETALEIRSDYAETLVLLGNACEALGRRSEAASHYRRVLTIQPTHGKAREALNRLSVAEVTP